MKRLPFYMCAAMLAAGTMTTTAYAANVNTCNVPGGKAIVIGGGSLEDLKTVLGQLQGNSDWTCAGNSFPGGGSGNGACYGDWMAGGWSCGDNSGTDLPGILFPGGGNTGDDIMGGGQEVPGGTDKPGSSEDTEQPDGGSTQDAYAAQVVKLVNEEREKAGLPALKVHTKAESAAMVRAKEIERSFSHTRPNGSSFDTALRQAGISYQSAGENIAYGQTSPGQVMNVWMNSSGHRANILNSNFTSIAVAHYRNASGVDYWVQLFLK